MIFMSFMRLDNLLKIICISIIFLYACTSNQLTNTADSCIIFDQMKNWYSLWSKSGANPNFRVQDSELYLSNFNWIYNWC